MAEELKSALELTLEKLNRESDATVKKLSPEQKEIIAEIRKKYKAKILIELHALQKMIQQWFASLL